MAEWQTIEKLIIDNLYIGDNKMIDLINSGRLVIVGICSECEHRQPELKAVYEGEVIDVTQPRCTIWCSYIDDNGWCYKFAERKPE